MNKKIGFIGCGNMGKAILTGILSSSEVANDNVYVSTKSDKSRKSIEEEFKVKTTLNSNEVAKFSDILFLAIKPNVFKEVLLDIKDHINKNAIIISIAAGISMDNMEEWLGDDYKIVRTMPNTPALVGEAISAIYPNKNLKENEIEEVCKIFKMFGIESENAHIINGHVPIHHMEGESPIKCNGKVIIIDGGFSQPYHKVTGIAGYTLIYNSYGLMLTAHEPFKSVDDTIRNGIDMQTNRVASEVSQKRILVGDTDNGKEIRENIKDLKELIQAYRNGAIRQNQRP